MQERRFNTIGQSIWARRAASPVFQADDINDDERADRKLLHVSRLVRDTKCAREIKELHAHTCQLCGAQFTLCPGSYYSEAHHLQPLGAPYQGPDKKEADTARWETSAKGRELGELS
jgi:predicted restriction endonuclease